MPVWLIKIMCTLALQRTRLFLDRVVQAGAEEVVGGDRAQYSQEVISVGIDSRAIGVHPAERAFMRVVGVLQGRLFAMAWGTSELLAPGLFNKRIKSRFVRAILIRWAATPSHSALLIKNSRLLLDVGLAHRVSVDNPALVEEDDEFFLCATGCCAKQAHNRNI